MKKEVVNLAVFVLLTFTLMGCDESDNLSSYPRNYKIDKTILDEGKVQIKYADGTIEIRPDNTGNFSHLYSTNILGIYMPLEPTLGSMDYYWFENHSIELLNIIKMQVEDNNSIERYIEYENTFSPNIFRKINMRSQTINYLVSP